MLLGLIAFLGGVLTILSPCVLPVLPFVLARTGAPFLRNGLPLLAGMMASFVAVALLAAVGGGLAVATNQWGRALALALMALFGLALLLPALGDRLAHPLVALGGRMAGGESGSVRSSLLLGVATGLLWTPCAGPILGVVLTGAALSGPSIGTAGLLAAYALGAAAVLALVMLAGARVGRALRATLGAGVVARRVAGAAVLVSVGAIALGVDTGFLARISTAGTTAIESRLLDRIRPQAPIAADARPLQSLTGPGEWLNSPPLDAAALRGKVVLIDFWTYSCINCLRTLPYVRAWHERYKDHGLTVIGVHTPEFAFERDLANVRRAVADLGITYPVVTDNDYRIWLGFENQYWPAHYFIDGMGRVRATHFGEGAYDESERTIQALLRETGVRGVPGILAEPDRTGVSAAADTGGERTHETYLGYERADRFASPEPVARGKPALYSAPGELGPDGWSLAGEWRIEDERSEATASGGRIVMRFRARDLHLVLGSGAGPVRFRVRLDGADPGPDHGLDTGADGAGTVTDERLYQLVRQREPRERRFEIEFLDPGVRAYAFTFG